MGARSSRSLSANLSRREPDDKEFEAATDEMHQGTDRVAAIIGAALVENSLRHGIECHLEDISDRNALFHDAGAPFGTFRARIVAGKAMGLIGEKAAIDLDIIRDIRNQFAHALLSLSFNNELIAAECERLSDYDPDTKMDNSGVSRPRLRYESACWEISLAIMDKGNERLDERISVLGKVVRLLEKQISEKERKALQNVRTLGGLGAIIASATKSGDQDIQDDVGSAERGIEG